MNVQASRVRFHILDRETMPDSYVVGQEHKMCGAVGGHLCLPIRLDASTDETARASRRG